MSREEAKDKEEKQLLPKAQAAAAAAAVTPHFGPNCVYPFLMRPLPTMTTMLTTKPHNNAGCPPPPPPPLLVTIHQLHHAITSTIGRCSTSLRNLLASAFSNPHPLPPLLRVRRGGQGNPTSLLRKHGFAAVLPGDSVAGVVVANGILNFLNLYNTLLVVRLVLTWFPNAPPAVVSPLSTLCDPYLNIFRGIIPPLGGTLDLSPILAFLVLNAFTSTAQALPAELPPTPPSPSSARLAAGGLTSLQEKWMRRLQGKTRRGSCDAS